MLPDPEFSVHGLMGALYTRLHLALVRSGQDDIGVSFPLAGKGGLGSLMRLHGTAAALQRLDPPSWLQGLRDHVSARGAFEVPSGVPHCEVRRVQAKSSPDRLRRRQMKRHGLTEEQARERIPDTAARRLTDPYLQISSRSTGQVFRLFVRQGRPGVPAAPGRFNSYGLSRTATVPWF